MYDISRDAKETTNPAEIWAIASRKHTVWYGGCSVLFEIVFSVYRER